MICSTISMIGALETRIPAKNGTHETEVKADDEKVECATSKHDSFQALRRERATNLWRCLGIALSELLNVAID